MATLRVLMLADEKPGHFRLSEGVIAALERKVSVELDRLEVHRRFLSPGRLLSSMVAKGYAPHTILKTGYGLQADALPAADLVVSAGGNTLAANIAAARHLDAANIFIGSLRRFPAEAFDLVITSYQRFADRPRHMVSLKPSSIDPEKLARPHRVPVFGPDNPPATAGLLIGGDTPDHRFSQDEWRRLAGILTDLHAQWGTRWLVSNSRRTPEYASNLIGQAAGRTAAVEEFIDVRDAGSGGVEPIFSKADIMLCTDDSSTMISEAIAARLPVVGLQPKIYGFTPQESEYRDYLGINNWTRTLGIGDLSAESLSAALSEIRVMADNHLDILARRLEKRLPQLFA